MISIVVPALNEERYIGRCLNSLKDQDYAGEYEIIVVDNGSQDGTASVVREAGVRLVECPQRGVSYARQVGAEAAKGEIVVQADADTLYPRWWLKRIRSQFDRHPEAAAVAGPFIYERPPWWARTEYALRVVFNWLSYWVLKRPYIISGANFAFFRRYLLQIGGYQHNSYSADQYNISSRLSKCGRVVYDGRSWCATSNRSVSKPFYVIVSDFFQHLARFARHITRRRSAARAANERVGRLSAKTVLKIVIPAFLVGFLCYGYFVPASPVFGKVYGHATTPLKVIALTFDDGPNEPYTSEVLDILECENVHATFFVVGANVVLYPSTLKRMVSDGDVVGNHTYSHNANHALAFNAYKDIQHAENAIEDTIGLKPHLYRPPHGKKSPWELQAIKGEGYAEVLWSISTPELNQATPQKMAQDIVNKARPGGIILLHDGYGTLHGSGRALKTKTVAMLPQVIQGLKDKGYTLVTVPQLLNVPAYDQGAK